MYAYVVFTLFYANVSVSRYKCLYFTENLSFAPEWFGYTEAIQKFVALISIPLIGWLSDIIGRKKILIATLLLQAITQLLFIYLPHNLCYFCILEACNGISTSNIVMLQLILVDRVPMIKERSWWISKVTSLVFLSALIASITVIYTYDYNRELVWKIASGINIMNGVLVHLFLPESMTKKETKTSWWRTLTGLRLIDYATFCVNFCHAVSFFGQLIYVTHYMKNELYLNDKLIGWIRFGQSVTTIITVYCYSYVENYASHLTLMTIGTCVQTLGAVLTATFMKTKDVIVFTILHIGSHSFTSVVFAAIGSILSERSNDLGVVMSTNKTVETSAFGVAALLAGFLYTQISFTILYYVAAGFSGLAFLVTIVTSKVGSNKGDIDIEE